MIWEPTWLSWGALPPAGKQGCSVCTSLSGTDLFTLHCSLYNNIKPPSWLGPGTDFHLFKEGVEPKWEDATCESGGKWTVLVPKGPNAKQVLDTYWLNAVRNRPTPKHGHQHV